MCVDIVSECRVAVKDQIQQDAMLSCGANWNNFLVAWDREEATYIQQ
jgi:hypothetical protein